MSGPQARRATRDGRRRILAPKSRRRADTYDMDSESDIWVAAARDSFAAVDALPDEQAVTRLAAVIEELAGMDYASRRDFAEANCAGEELAAALDWIEDSDDSHWDEEE